ncbi:MAG TPA: sensor histidine kinase [Vicinamibacterales bacterium]|nr:sensor histidine kinase [Vicinamibacterales bacterium]
MGLALAVCTIAAIGVYTYTEILELRDEQTAISDRNRKDSLQLLRIQNNLASLAVLMRDMADGTEPYPLQGWRPAFERVRRDLAEATRLEQELAPAVREPAQQGRLVETVGAYWAEVDRMFAVSRTDEDEARRLIRTSLIPQHRAIDSLVAQFLVANNQVQEDAARANRAVYDRVARDILVLVTVLLIVTAGIGTWVVAANRRAFNEVSEVSAELRTLSWRMLRVQEDVQRAISRELHDDFGQIVTAVGTLLGRARRHAGGGALAAELEHVRHIAQQALDRIRHQSRWLHPGVLDDFGLQRALETCVEQFQQQTGIRTTLAVSGPVQTIADDCAIHVYRIVQEALSNVARHSSSPEASVRLTCDAERLELEVADRGTGLKDAVVAREVDRGMGLISMRERAELVGGELHVRRRPGGGTTVHLVVPNDTGETPARHEVA